MYFKKRFFIDCSYWKDCSDVGEKCWWKKVCWWRISVMLVKGMLVKKSIFMYVGEECWRRKLCMLVKNFSNVGEIVMLVKNLLLRCWWITEKHFHVCWWRMLVKVYVGEKSMLVKNFGNVGEEYVSEANISFHQHTISPTYLHQHTVFTNIRPVIRPSPTYSFHQHPGPKNIAER